MLPLGSRPRRGRHGAAYRLLCVTAAMLVLAADPGSAISGAAAMPTIHLCGDSTMARGSGKTEGWGQYLHYSFTGHAAVRNDAIGGRSARSFTREGRFDAVAKDVKAGDWVVIEFGHNDGGSLRSDNGRTDCGGAGSETCETTYNGVKETVQTYPTYLQNATRLFLAAGAAGVVLSSPTPNNPWETPDGSFRWSPDRFATYSRDSATAMGGPAGGVYYVPHGEYAAQAMRSLGKEAVDAQFPNDHTHTSAVLADVVARAFVLGLRCGTSPLGRMVINETETLENTFLGKCIRQPAGSPV